MAQLPCKKPTLFKCRHFNYLLIIQAVRWYVTYKFEAEIAAQQVRRERAVIFIIVR
jgi:hypothetical protein